MNRQPSPTSESDVAHRQNLDLVSGHFSGFDSFSALVLEALGFS